MSLRLVPVVFIGILTVGGLHSTPATPWLEETFDTYKLGPLDGQGGWTGSTRHIAVVSTTSLAGNAVLCDADESPMLPVEWEVQRPLVAPDSGEHVFSFAVRVETPTASFGEQAALILGNDQTPAIALFVWPETVMMTINNDFLLMPPPTRSWDLGSVPGGAPDLTTGTFHVLELDLDFGQAGNTYDDFVRNVRLDGQTVSGFDGPIWLIKPIDRLILINGDSVEGATPDAVFFDSITGRPVALGVRHWHLY